MTYTSHGHQIEGTPVTRPRPVSKVRCGGPRLCGVCKRQSELVVAQEPLPERMLWVYYKGQLTNIIEEYNTPELLAEKFPDAIYFYAGLVPLEE